MIACPEDFDNRADQPSKATKAYGLTHVSVAKAAVLLAAIALFLLSATSTAHAAPGDLDPSFGVNGLAILASTEFTGPFYGLTTQPDAKIIASGAGVIPFSSSAPYLARYNANGSLDGSFGAGGLVLVEPWAGFGTGLAVQSDGKILTVKNDSVLRYSSVGALEATFPDDLHNCVNGLCVSAIAVQPDGSILAATGTGLVRYDAGGSYDASFASGGAATSTFIYRGMALQSDGKIVVAGGTNGLVVVARYESSGAADLTFGSGGQVLLARNYNTGALGVASQPDGKILVVSTDRMRPLTPSSASVLMRFDVNGSLDSSFGSGGIVETAIGTEGYASQIALQADGKIVVAGQDAGMFVTRYDLNGSVDAGFGLAGTTVIGPIGGANALSIQADGKILVAGWGGMSGSPTVARLMADNSPLLNTPAGSAVRVVLGGGVSVNFASVTTPGNTSVTASSTGPAPPAGYQIGNPPIWYDIQTTAIYTAPVTVCLTYDPSGYADPGLAQLFHYESGAWQDVTTSNDTTTGVICGQSSSLSPFAIMTAAPFVAEVQPPIAGDGSSVFTANRDAIPVKFNLASGGQSTCSLPAATIAVFRVDGSMNQPIPESVYSAPPDTGSQFRTAGCKYLYNLASKALGKGNYLVQIVIENSVAGDARFALK